MKRKFIIIIIAAFAFVCRAQDFNVRYIKINSENFPHLTSIIQVYNNFNDPIKDLTKDNISITIDGKKADSIGVETYKASGLGLNLLLCLDLSGTMKGQPLKSMKGAILNFIDDLRDNDNLAILGFANDAFLISDFSNDKDFLKNKVKELNTSGTETALYYGAYKGLKKLTDNSEQRGRVLILIGDGKNESSSSSFTEDEVIDLANQEGIPVFTIGYTKISKAYLQSLERISEKTGGNFYESPSDEDLDKQYKKIYNQILNLYLINCIASGIKDDGYEHVSVITVRYNDDKKTISKNFIAPAGVVINDSEEISTEINIEYWYYLIAGVIFIGIVVLLFLKRSRRKREEIERKKNEQLEDELKKREKIENKVKELEEIKSKQIENKSEKPPTIIEKTKIVPNVNPDRTIILTEGTNSKPGINNLKLDFVVGSCSGKSFNITKSGAAIGRADDNSIVIKDETISGHHAKIEFSGELFVVEDLNSSNGTYINGKKISRAKLANGDTFKFGKCEGTITIY